MAEGESPTAAATSQAGDQAADVSAGSGADTAGAVDQFRTDQPVSAPINEAPPDVEHRPAGDGYVSRLPELHPGDTGAATMLLARLLRAHGYDNPQARGEAAPVLDNALMDRVREFQAAKKIDPTVPEEGAAQARWRREGFAGVVDARTWQALMPARQHKEYRQ